MKTTFKLLLTACLISGTILAANAQESFTQVSQKPGKYEVTTRLMEKEGSYEQRKLYRQFLTDYMKNCPFISNFSIHEAVDANNNHEVVWTYDANGWNGITQFYNWISQQVKAGKDDVLKKAMTPYAPDYAIGGQIQLERNSASNVAKNKDKLNNNNG